MFGAAVDADTRFFWSLYTAGDIHTGVVQGAGFHASGDSSPGGYPYMPTVADFTTLSFNTDFGSEGCHAGGPLQRASDPPPCYEVPEPGSLLLLMTGIGGVGLMCRRRRRV